MSKSAVKMDIDFCNILIKKRSLRFDYKEAKVIKMHSCSEFSRDKMNALFFSKIIIFNFCNFLFTFIYRMY